VEPIYLIIIIGLVFAVCIILSLWRDKSLTKSIAINNLIISFFGVFFLLSAFYLEETCSGLNCLASIAPAFAGVFIAIFQVVAIIVALTLSAFKVSNLNKLFRILYLAFYGITALLVLLYLIDL